MSSEKLSSESPEISIVIPMYNESEGIEVLFSKLKLVLEKITAQYEIVCVDDGSEDDTLKKLKIFALADPRIKYISLSRNFGKEAALSAGIDFVKGKAAIPFDADLQDPPEVIPQLVEKWREGYKVVLATRKTRLGDGFVKRFTAHCFYWVMAKLSNVPIPNDTGDFRLIDSSVVEVIRLLPERTRFMKGLFAWAGFKTAIVYYDRASRAKGDSKLSFVKLVALAKDGVFSFSTAPLRLTTYAGCSVSLLAIAYGVYLIIKTIVLGADVPGYPSIMVTVLFIGGVQLISIGVLGEYIGRIYNETKQRPLYVVEERSDTIGN